MSTTHRVAVVGATGAVGEELRRQLDSRGFPLAGDPVFVASERSAGRRLPWKDREVEVQALGPDVFDDVDIALFSAGATRSREFAPIAVEAGAVVVDNSSAFRMDDEVPLVVSEVNPEDARTRPKGIIANPNCTTMVLMVPAKPLHDAFGLREMVATTYQAAGGSGQSGITELVEQARKLVDDVDRLRTEGLDAEAAVSPDNFSKAIAFNVLAHCGDFEDDRYTVEERKLVDESRKILSIASLKVSPTCVRVPVVVGHSIAARLTFRDEVSRAAAMQVLADAPGMVVEDGTGRDGEELAYPTPLGSAGRDEVVVGRIREDLGDPHSLNLFVSGDNLLKGAALNTVQLAELVAAERA
ncbi:aspartate-semialdehyde dehydrogenase [Salsipaludibacter albus]|uniref:aspartate-semialdehyde dehydrogenase n=1 Tax=Salsipaludibacter albus TaxID=2849650 RepID=UPI001EE4E808|nr:aspartate-semialdehyde dehydrogenase [Salsipaludibacter albus]MBY5164479.1 aspartate-semialdehyde dehydrogenase [Salsipaludibacter albus]